MEKKPVDSRLFCQVSTPQQNWGGCLVPWQHLEDYDSILMSVTVSLALIGNVNGILEKLCRIGIKPVDCEVPCAEHWNILRCTKSSLGQIAERVDGIKAHRAGSTATLTARALLDLEVVLPKSPQQTISCQHAVQGWVTVHRSCCCLWVGHSYGGGLLKCRKWIGGH